MNSICCWDTSNRYCHGWLIIHVHQPTTVDNSQVILSITVSSAFQVLLGHKYIDCLVHPKVVRILTQGLTQFLLVNSEKSLADASGCPSGCPSQNSQNFHFLKQRASWNAYFFLRVSLKQHQHTTKKIKQADFANNNNNNNMYHSATNIPKKSKGTRYCKLVIWVFP